MKDSGERVTHTTGAVRDSAAGRGRYDLISPIMMERLALHLEKGASKYEERNWEKGLPIARMFASLFRHSWQAFMQETDEDHLAAVVCDAMFIMHTLEMIVRGRLSGALNDLPSYTPLIPQEVEAAGEPHPPLMVRLVTPTICERCRGKADRVIRVGFDRFGGVYCSYCRLIMPLPCRRSEESQGLEDICVKCGQKWPECGHD